MLYKGDNKSFKCIYRRPRIGINTVVYALDIGDMWGRRSYIYISLKESEYYYFSIAMSLFFKKKKTPHNIIKRLCKSNNIIWST